MCSTQFHVRQEQELKARILDALEAKLEEWEKLEERYEEGNELMVEAIRNWRHGMAIAAILVECTQ